MIPVRQRWPEEFADRYRREGYWNGETFGSFLRARAEKWPDRPAVLDTDNRWTYAELDARADAVARGFLSLGFEPGDRVIVQLPNRAEFLSVVLGLCRVGILPVFALPAHRRAEIVHFARAAEVTGYVIADVHAGFDYRDLAGEVAREIPAIRSVVVVGDPGPWLALEEVVDVPLSPWDMPNPGPSDAVFLQLSGGSTGFSKLIPRTHNDYLYSVRESAAICQLDTSTVYLGTLPIGHNFPLSSPGVLGTLAAGGTVALSPAPDPATAFPIIEREGVTITAVVPPLALMWIMAAGTTTLDLSSLRVLQVGGARLDPQVASQIGPALGVTLQQVFGMAEGLVCYTRLDDPEDVILGTQGRPISPADEIRILGEEGDEKETGVPGVLYTRGPYTIRAYHNAPEADARAFTEDGFYRTGDVVSRTAEGNLVVHGRATDVVNRGGEKISAEEVETELIAHPSVLDAVLIPVPDPVLGERSCAVVVPWGAPPTGPDIREWVRSRGLAEYKVPDRVEFVPEFPSTGVGKVDRTRLRSLLREQVLKPKMAGGVE